MSKLDYVTASEVGEYTYCPRGWWLRFNGLLETTPQMVAGTAYHDTLSSKVRLFNFIKILSLIFLLIGLVSLLFLWLVF